MGKRQVCSVVVALALIGLVYGGCGQPTSGAPDLGNHASTKSSAVTGKTSARQDGAQGRVGWRAYGGAIFRTADAGATWHTMTASSGMILPVDAQTCVVFKDSYHGSTANDASYSATSDSGKTWKSVPIQETKPYVVPVLFTSASEGWGTSLEDPSQSEYSLKHTVDAGKTWETAYPTGAGETGPSKIAGICFLNSSVGWVAIERDHDGGYSGSLLMTKDGGKSWTEKPVGEDLLPTAVRFESDNEGWVTGSQFSGDPNSPTTTVNEVVMHTTDGGSTWTKVPIADPITAQAALANQSWLRTSYLEAKGNRVWAVLSCEDPGAGVHGNNASMIMRSDDGGTTFHGINEPEDPDTPVPLVDAIQFFDEGHGWIEIEVASPLDGGGAYFTTDGGQTWHPSESGAGPS